MSLGVGHDAAGSGDSSLVPLSLWAADRLFFEMLTTGESLLFACTPHAFLYCEVSVMRQVMCP